MKLKGYLKVIALLGVCGFLLYGNSLQGDFIFDDYNVIVHNPVVQHVTDIGAIWRYDPTRFIAYYSLAWNYAFSGLDVVPYHVVNVLLHIACALFVFIFFRSILSEKESGPLVLAPYLGSLIFLMHPLQTSAVTMIVQRSTIWATLFYLLALICYVRYRKQDKKWWLVPLFLFSFFGSCSKPIVISLPFSIVLVEFLIFKEKKRPKMALVVPLALLAMMSAALFSFFLVFLELNLKQVAGLGVSGILSSIRQTTTITRYQYLLTQFDVIVQYLRLSVFPIGQNFDHNFQIVKSFFAYPVYLSLFLIVGVLALGSACVKRRKLLAFGIFWFFLTLMPESSLFPIIDVMLEHRLYLPMVGFSLFLSVLIVQQIRNVKIQRGVALAVILALGALTMHRNYILSDPERLLKDTIQKSPKNVRAIHNLCAFYFRNGRETEGRQQLYQAIKIDPKYPPNYYKLGLLYELEGRKDKAFEEFEKAVFLQETPLYDFCYLKLGDLYQQRENIEGAKEMYQTAMYLNPKSAHACWGLADSYRSQGEDAKAVYYYRLSLRIDPHNFDVRHRLAKTYWENENILEASKQFFEMVRRFPQNHIGYKRLAQIYLRRSDLTKASALLKRALLLNSKDPEVYEIAAKIQYAMNDVKEAEENIRRAVNLMVIEGRKEEAKALAQQFLGDQ